MDQDLAKDTGQCNRPVVGRDRFFPFLKIGETFASFQMSGSFPVSKDLWKMSYRIGANSLCKVCRTMGLKLSGPAALCGFTPTSILSVPSANMLISDILVWGLGWNGGLAPESCNSCVVTSGQGALNLWGSWG